ncbi:MAG: hypothetical protein AAGL29_16455 [Bacteroidota bacterium]
MMKKLKHYPNVWQASPFSMEMFAHYEKDARLQNQQETKASDVQQEKKSKLRLALGW